MNIRQLGIVFCLTISMAACSGTADGPVLPDVEGPNVIQPGAGDSVILPEKTPIATGAVTVDSPTQPAPDQPVTNDPGEQAPTTKPADYTPKPGDDKLARGPAYIDRMELLSLESYPLQPVLALAGSLPDPCHALRVLVNPPDADGNIAIEVYSVADPEKICTQVLTGFEQTVPLSPIPSGKYSVTVNGKTVGEFEMP